MIPPTDTTEESAPDRAALGCDDRGVSGCENWPQPIDILYFQSELRVALEYQEIARSEPEFAQECTRRALQMYVLLSGWVQCNGGNARLEDQLQRLRWRIVKMQEELTLTSGED